MSKRYPVDPYDDEEFRQLLHEVKGAKSYGRVIAWVGLLLLFFLIVLPAVLMVLVVSRMLS